MSAYACLGPSQYCNYSISQGHDAEQALEPASLDTGVLAYRLNSKEGWIDTEGEAGHHLYDPVTLIQVGTGLSETLACKSASNLS